MTKQEQLKKEQEFEKDTFMIETLPLCCEILNSIMYYYDEEDGNQKKSKFHEKVFHGELYRTLIEIGELMNQGDYLDQSNYAYTIQNSIYQFLNEKNYPNNIKIYCEAFVKVYNDHYDLCQEILKCDLPFLEMLKAWDEEEKKQEGQQEVQQEGQQIQSHSALSKKE